MAARRRVSLEPAAAAEALRDCDPDVTRPWDALVAGDVEAVLVGGAVPAQAAWLEPRCLLPGSFNPVHEGHRRMLAMAADRLDAAGAAFELAIVNPDKPPLAREDTARRLARFAGSEAVWLTRAPTFPEKARIFPGVAFAVGVDTIVRIAEPRYYGGIEGLGRALSVLGRCRFLVFGRRTGSTFETLESVTLPAPLRAICDGLPESDFRADISSTELRKIRREIGSGQISGTGNLP